MKYLPVGLDFRGRPCLVIGGGEVGARKVRTLLEAGAAVTLVSPQATTELVELSSSGRIRWIRERFHPDVLHGSFLAVAATDDEGSNAEVVRQARARGVLICDASSADRSQVIFGALHRGERVTVAVFTDGTDPSLARGTRDRIAAIEKEWVDAEEGD